ncbi:MAG: divalent-cation tolerance protein CutA [Mariprofundaceae bacterium]
MQATCVIIHTSVADEREANRLARAALESRLAACVQILGPGRSIYRWQGAVEESDEYYLSFKTAAAKRDALMDWLGRQHPYDVPEMVCTDCTTSEDYGNWLIHATTIQTDT